MEQQLRITVIEPTDFERLVTKIVSEQNQALLIAISELLHKNINPLDADHITTKQLMKELGVTRNTIQNYRKNGILPPPNFDLSGHPYWTAEQLATFLNERKAKRKYPI